MRLYYGRTGMRTYRRAYAAWKAIHGGTPFVLDTPDPRPWEATHHPLTPQEQRVCELSLRFGARGTRKRKGPGQLSRADRNRARDRLGQLERLIKDHTRTPSIGLLLDSAAYG